MTSMTSPEEMVINILKAEGIDLTATLPCDRTKDLLALIPEAFEEIRLTREENGVGICAGAYLAGATPMMIIQSTGLGNMINALASLNMVCRIPLPVLASWRGVYMEGIDAQMPLGVQLPGILEGANFPYTVIDEVEKLQLLHHVIRDAYETRTPHIALVSPKVWENSPCLAWKHQPPLTIQERIPVQLSVNELLQPEILRFEAISAISEVFDREWVVANLGIPSKELYAASDRKRNYYMTGSMGLASAIGMGLALRSKEKVVVLDGDGSILMNPNAIVEAANRQSSNLIIVALDNACYGSTGSQTTFTCHTTDLELFAKSVGVAHTAKVHTAKDLKQTYERFKAKDRLGFIHVVLKPGNTKVPNIPLTPAQITERFKEEITH